MSDASRLEIWRHRADRRLLLMPYLALIGSTVLVIVARDLDLPAQPLPVTLTVAAVTAGWILWMVTLHPEWSDRPRLMATFFAGLLVLIGVLIWCNPLFGFFAWTGYLLTIYTLRGRWRLAGAGGVACFTAVSQVGGYPTLAEAKNWPSFLLVLLFNVGIAVTMTFLAVATSDHAARRAEMLRELTEANDKLAAALTENAGLHAQLLVQAREAGVLDERQRMAGEIHDVLAQGLTGIVTQLEAADQAGDRETERRRHLDTARQLARDSLTEARRSVQALRPQQLTGTALPEALAEVVDGWSEVNGVFAELITTGTALPLLPEIEATLLRTAQEALANVARHAAADRVALTLSYMEDLVTLDVRDDGAGFDPAQSRTDEYEGGYGLTAMRERVQRISGTLAVESEPGGGTAISACVPAIHVAVAA
ncbi:sensor histidine kinase [Actinoplanes friuliensis]|uniref:Oxygen sensor histidine kinase NreB n=1 Tax=Actinoplanes friuliensis DSM 7358 TaxID=1246995 RepID=U5W998_9ACTN|nr:sensor histidine kinase [Actinoplanes friuliensis]AGZ44521.1 putative two-component system sensor kinase [Actinoplanes friuliensis DSM 7358]